MNLQISTATTLVQVTSITHLSLGDNLLTHPIELITYTS